MARVRVSVRVTARVRICVYFPAVQRPLQRKIFSAKDLVGVRVRG